MFARQFRRLRRLGVRACLLASTGKSNRLRQKNRRAPRLTLELLETRALLSTFVVNVADDLDYGSCTEGHCSLREAINAANQQPGLDEIHFDIAESGIPAIREDRFLLPEIVDPIVIDGTTQPAGKVEVRGGNAYGSGLRLKTHDSVIRGLVINGYRYDGIVVSGDRNLIEGNFIGTNADGTVPLGNRNGISIRGSGNTIGGTTPESRNLISGNGNGLEIYGDYTLVQGNYFGTDVTGTSDLSGENDTWWDGGGMWIKGLHNTIGGTTPGAGNLISALNEGIRLDGNQYTVTRYNVIQGNQIGTDVTGTQNLGNHSTIVIAGASDNLIGGEEDGAGNIIAFGRADSIIIFDEAPLSTGNAILRNAIFGGLGLSISHGHDYGSQTPNDLLDGDTGANEHQNHPVLTSAGTVVRGRLNSTPNTVFRLEFSASRTAHPRGFGQGETYLGSSSVTTGPDGNADFAVRLDSFGPSGHFVAATATDPNNNTSEFSPALELNQFEVNSASDESDADFNDGVCDVDLVLAGEQCTLRAAIQAANVTPGIQFIDFAIPDPVAAIIPASSLPTITERVVIDGTTQPGFAGTPIIELDGSTAGTNTDGLFIIGGSTTIRGIAINRFGGSGVVLQDGGQNAIEQNVIGLDRSGTIDRRNSGHGVLIDSSSANTIGGSSAAKGNQIGFNGRNGVTVVSTRGPASANNILTNSIFSNRGLGIDLGDDDVQINDALDADYGANGLQNSPVLAEVVEGPHTLIRGSINSTPRTDLLLQFFAATPSDSRPAQRPLGSTHVTTDALGNADYSLWLSAASHEGESATATATDQVGNTSEFTVAVPIIPNRAPHADAGGPYRITEDWHGMLDAAVSTDHEQPTADLLYAWDLDGDGSFGEVGQDAVRGDEIGMRPTFSARGIFAQTTLQVPLVVTDDGGKTDFDTAEIVIVVNEAPLADAGGPYAVSLERTEQFVTLDASATSDVNQPADTLRYEWDLDGDGAFGETSWWAQRGDEIGLHPVFRVPPGLRPPLHMPVRLRVTDDRGLVAENTTFVRLTYLLPIGGTSASDVIVVTPSVSGSELVVTVNGSVTRYDLEDVTRLVIEGREGNDRIEIAESLWQDSTVWGGVGNDTIMGGGGNDLIEAGLGNDRLSGGGGNDVVNGDSGNDTIVASRGNDMLRLGSGRNSIVMGDLSPSVQRLWGFASSRVGENSSRIDVSLGSTLSGSIRFSAQTSGLVKRCNMTFEVSGDGTVSNLAHTSVLKGRTSVRCIGQPETAWGTVLENLTGRIDLQAAAITTTGTIETAFGSEVSRKRVRGTDALIEVGMEIA